MRYDRLVVGPAFQTELLQSPAQLEVLPAVLQKILIEQPGFLDEFLADRHIAGPEEGAGIVGHHIFAGTAWVQFFDVVDPTQHHRPRILTVHGQMLPQQRRIGERIVVHEQDDLAIAVADAQIAGAGQTVVGFGKNLDPATAFGCQGASHIRRTVGAAVVHEHDLVLVLGEILGHQGPQGAFQQMFAVVAANLDADTNRQIETTFTSRIWE